MNLLVIGANYRTAPLSLRERLTLPKERQAAVLRQLASDLTAEAVLLATCNRAELYLGCDELHGRDAMAARFANLFQLARSDVGEALFTHDGAGAVRHLFRVTASLDSLVLGETQIAGQVRDAYEAAVAAGTVGPLLHPLFQQTRVLAKRIRRETGLTAGKVSVSSLAIDYLKQVFDRFDNKTILVIGTGKIGELTLKQLAELHPRRILVTNRSPEKAAAVAAGCGGQALPWQQLDEALIAADIVLSTTGAAEPIVTLGRFTPLAARRAGRSLAIVDLAVPRDFDPVIGELDEVELLINVDDLERIREKVLADRRRHLPAAEQLVAAEVERFSQDWSRRGTGAAIAKLSKDWDAIRQEVEKQCLGKLNGKLTPAEQEQVRGALRLLQNRLMHTPMAVLQEEAKAGRHGGLLEAIRKLFRLAD